MNNIEEMIASWKAMDSKLSALLEENRKLAEEIKKNKLYGTREKLMRKYLIFIILAFICIPLISLVLIKNPLIIDKYRWPTLIYYVCFFLLEIIFDSYLLYRLSRMDIYNDSIVYISACARSNWKIHKIAVLIGIPLAIGAVTLFCLALGGDTDALVGVCLGGCIGLAIGLNEFFKFMKNYKSMIRENSPLK